MVSTNNVVSDSQESAIIDEETYMAIENTFGGSLPIKPEDMNDFNILEERPIQLSQVASTCEEQKRNIKRPLEEDYDDEKEIYYRNAYYNYLSRPVTFQFNVPDNGGGQGQDWMYSETSNKLYIKMEKVLPLRFTWEPARPGVFLRTELVYLFDEHKSDPVKRCYNHTAVTYPANQDMDPDRIKHVVQCVNIPSSYEENDGGHLSVVTPIRPPEGDSRYVMVYFKFFCKNSCQSGMNRRATELIFTLEDERRQILAQSQRMIIRICSCPKRDKIKDESECKESSVKQMKPLTANKKMLSCDKHVYKVELNVVGKENYLAVHKYAYDIMAGQAAKTGQHDFFKPYMDEVLNKIP